MEYKDILQFFTYFDSSFMVSRKFLANKNIFRGVQPVIVTGTRRTGLGASRRHMYIAGHQYVNCTWHTGYEQHNSVLFHNSKELYLSLYYSYTEMKKLVILVFSCALQFTYGSEPNIDGTIIANAKSPMDRRDPRLFFGVRNKCILSHQTSITFGKVVSEVSFFK